MKVICNKLTKRMILFSGMAFLFNASLNAAELEINKEFIFSPSRLGTISVSHNDDGFHVMKDETRYNVESYFVDPDIRNIKNDQLTEFLKHGYLHVDQIGNEDFTIKAHVKGLGGGPFSGILAGIGTVAGVIACGITGNAPGAIALVYAAPAIIGGAIVAPIP